MYFYTQVHSTISQLTDISRKKVYALVSEAKANAAINSTTQILAPYRAIKSIT